MSDIDKRFTGSIPQVYGTFLVPLIFEPYAADLQSRISSIRPARILEIAAGTGVVTRALAASASPDTSIVATDLNQAMLDEAAAAGTPRPVEWRRADAMALPFADNEFDAVVCQFGVMFFPDKARAFAEARRALKPGGVFVFNVWDRIPETSSRTPSRMRWLVCFQTTRPGSSPGPRTGITTCQRFNAMAAGGFTSSPQIETVGARSRAESAHLPAFAYCQGTPLKNEIEARDASRITEAVDAATAAVAQQFGSHGVEGKIQAHVVTIRK